MMRANANQPVIDATTDVTVVLLTYNEEVNIAQALDSVIGWARAVYVLDSYSTDRTLDIARGRGVVIYQHRFTDYAAQRQHALDALPIATEWTLFLDADEWLPGDLRAEISALIQRRPPENGFFVRWRLIWMGRWIRRGYYPSWILRLFRTGTARCEARSVGEHLVVDGATGRLTRHFIHEDRKGIAAWIDKHNGYATREAVELLVRAQGADAQRMPGRLFGSQRERTRWLRDRVWSRLPPLLRPFLYFLYRYAIRGGFLDGREALIYHFLQALWFPFLIDAKYLEARAKQRAGPV